MRVEIERDLPTRRWKVWVLRDGEPSWQWFPAASPGEGTGWIEIKAQPGEPLPPSMFIDDEVWVPLTAAILGLPTDQAPLADHLNDARKVRDRLLRLIEVRWLDDTPDPRSES